MEKNIALAITDFRISLKGLIETSGLPANVMLDTVRFYCQNLEKIAAKEYEALQRQAAESAEDTGKEEGEGNAE